MIYLGTGQFSFCLKKMILMEKMNGKPLSLIKCAVTVVLYSVTDKEGKIGAEGHKHLAVFLAKLLQVSILLLISILNKKKSKILNW